MTAETSNPSTGWNSIQDAFAEIRSIPGELENYVANLFDELDQTIDGFFVQELNDRHKEHQAEREAIQCQIDRLISLTSELTQTVTEQKQINGLRNRNGR